MNLFKDTDDIDDDIKIALRGYLVKNVKNIQFIKLRHHSKGEKY